MALSFSCPQGHKWDAPSGGVSLIGGKFVACPQCAALVLFDEQSKEPTEPMDGKGKRDSPLPEFGDAATLFQEHVETVHKLPASGLPNVENYELMTELGRGGMGVVYRARHKLLKRIVALKMVLSGQFASSDSLARFRAEAEAVAKLQHPNIIQIYEIGEQDHNPFFAMEFVDAGSLHDQLEHPLSARQAAHLMVTIARAVHHAHQQGIIHRDLKPPNILLASPPSGKGGPGRWIPKVTDFGLAKRLDEMQGQTRSGDVLGTPSYMAPEQAEGKLKYIGPHTDVYALGAILYEMLTARQAFRAETAMDTLLQVLYEDPVAPARLVPKLPPDLETICLKCLNKDIGKRYASADEFADELQRFLDGKPIQARPAGRVEKVVKWARRNRAQAALVCVVLMAVIGGLGMSIGFNFQLSRLNVQLKTEAARATRNEKRANEAKDEAIKNKNDAVTNAQKALKQKTRAEKERDRANKNFHKARDAVRKMLTEVGQSELAHIPYMGEVRRNLLEEAIKFHDEFVVLDRANPDVRREAAQAHLLVADIRFLLGDFDLAQQKYGFAILQFTDLARDYPKELLYQRDLADSYFQQGKFFQLLSKYPAAEKSFQESQSIRKSIANPAPDDRWQLARVLVDLALIHMKAAQFPEADKEFRQALAIHGKLVAENPKRLDYKEDLAGTLNDQGRYYLQVGKPKDAISAFADSLKRFTEIIDASADDEQYKQKQPQYRQKQASVLNNLGNALIADEDFPQAVTRLGEALAERMKLAGEFPATFVYRVEVAETHNNLAAALINEGKIKEAEKELVAAESVFQKLAMDVENSPDYRSQLAAVRDNLARAVYRNEPGRAQKLLDEALKGHHIALKEKPEHSLYQQFLRHHYSVQAEVSLQSRAKGAQKYAEAARQAGELVKHLPGHKDSYYQAAVILSNCAGFAGIDKNLTTAQRSSLWQQYGKAAVDQLGMAIQQGFDDKNRLEKENAFRAISKLPEFKKLVKKLEP